MSYADQVFIDMCRDILENGTSTEGEAVRPHWPDGTPAYTIKKFGVVNRYDLRKEFPAVTLRKTALKSAMDEILWIYQKKSNNIHDLKSHVWDEWADEYGSIGKAYGYQMAKRNKVTGITREGMMKAFGDCKIWECDHGDWLDEFFLTEGTAEEVRALQKTSVYAADKLLSTVAYAIRQEDFNPDAHGADWYMNQIDYVIYQLKNTPFSRRIITMLWNPSQAADMALEPCAYSVTFNVTQEKGADKLTLNAILNQRSQDILAANAWNVAQYALLVMMIAQVCDMIPGELIHVIADAHIYDRHVPLVEELIERTPQPAPKVWLNPEVKNFYKFTTDDLHVENYEVGGPQIKDIPIAV